MRIARIFGMDGPDENWCREQRDEMDWSVDGAHYADPRSPNAARWS